MRVPFLTARNVTRVHCGAPLAQGWNVQYGQEAYATEPLNVWLIPHSHNDPGWLQTVDQYFNSQTRSIITNVVNMLSQVAPRAHALLCCTSWGPQTLVK